MPKPIERGDVCECGKDSWWDNRATKKGKQPDFKCANKDCGKGVWLNSPRKSTGKPYTPKPKESTTTMVDSNLVQFAIQIADKKIPFEDVKIVYDKLKKIDAEVINAALDEVAETGEEVKWD